MGHCLGVRIMLYALVSLSQQREQLRISLSVNDTLPQSPPDPFCERLSMYVPGPGIVFCWCVLLKRNTVYSAHHARSPGRRESYRLPRIGGPFQRFKKKQKHRPGRTWSCRTSPTPRASRPIAARRAMPDTSGMWERCGRTSTTAIWVTLGTMGPSSMV